MPFPSVPFVPGVPSLPRDPSIVGTGISLLMSDPIGLVIRTLFPQWGIFRNGRGVVLADNVVSLDYKQDWSVSDYPIEQGAFESYNKVAQPFVARVRFSAGGSIISRQLLIDSVAAIAGTLDLYDVVTPEATYRNVNVTHYDYRRNADRGVGLVVVDVWLTEIRMAAAPLFSSTKLPSGADITNVGTVQGTTPSQSQSAAAAGAN